MHLLNDIQNKKIMLIVAHPDDETLWFFQSIQQLKSKNEITIFCITYSANSKRGQELKSAITDSQIKITFGNCEDTGISHLLKTIEVEQAFSKVFPNNSLDLVISHPPHGGEKPHPHHIQLYEMTRKYCKSHSVQFGFFSEQKILAKSLREHDYFFDLKKKKYILFRLLQGYRLLHKNEKKTAFFFRLGLSVVCDFKIYMGFESSVNLKEKQSALAKFESQEDILKNYNSFYRKFEFLFVERPKSNALLSIFF